MIVEFVAIFNRDGDVLEVFFNSLRNNCWFLQTELLDYKQKFRYFCTL